MSITQIGPKLYLVRVQFRDPKTKRKRSLERTVKGTRQAAAKVHRDLEEQRDVGGKRTPQRLAAFATSWLATRAPSLKPSVLAKYGNSLERHVLPVLGDHLMGAITTSDVQKYVNRRVADGAAGNTVLNELRLLRTIARDSVAERVSDRYWADRVKAPDVATYTEEDPNSLEAHQLAALLLAIPPAWRAVVTLMAFTGMRWGEASALRWEDLDIAGRVVRVRRSNWKGRSVAPKTKRSARSFPLPAPFLSMLEPVPKARRHGWLFPTKTGDLHRGTPLRAVLEKACDDAEVPRITAHGLRRTFNNLGRQKASKEAVKAVMGHTTDEMFSHYSTVHSSEMKQLIDSVVEWVLVPEPPASEDRSGSGETEETGDD